MPGSNAGTMNSRQAARQAAHNQAYMSSETWNRERTIDSYVEQEVFGHLVKIWNRENEAPYLCVKSGLSLFPVQPCVVGTNGSTKYIYCWGEDFYIHLWSSSDGKSWEWEAVQGVYSSEAEV